MEDEDAPIYSSVDPQIAQKHLEVLKAKKEDADIEFFWLTFKDSVINYLDKKTQTKIQDLSDTLNQLQLEKKYEEIQKIISNNLDEIAWRHVLTHDSYHGCHLITNLKRWRTISGKKLPRNELAFASLIVMIHYNEKYLKYFYQKNDKSEDDKIKQSVLKEILERLSDLAFEFVKDDATDESKDKAIIKIINYGIENKLESLIHHMYKCVNLTLFLKDKNDTVALKMISSKNGKARKILKILKPYKTT